MSSNTFQKSPSASHQWASSCCLTLSIGVGSTVDKEAGEEHVRETLRAGQQVRWQIKGLQRKSAGLIRHRVLAVPAHLSRSSS
ncbi:hypothetical protein SKAU_G00146860 [Synaphobranchus kaupii]|uniref:Uncharacterized protein n=1 Tax=Synaphobranchus kaupii TaxID=118154 RepID=A0A9Q1J4Y5_SYNKA|nr:hypothetical protein SKAU_G00146860 [Synaphobranchus kaupii]